jgi:hypothetical protein
VILTHVQTLFITSFLDRDCDFREKMALTTQNKAKREVLSEVRTAETPELEPLMQMILKNDALIEII